MGEFYKAIPGIARKTPYAPTILNKKDVFLCDCPKCGRTRINHTNRNISLLIEGKGKLPDYLMCGHYPFMIVSDRVLKAWEKVEITGYTSFPIELIDQQMEEIQNVQYHNIIIDGRAELDFDKMGIKIIKICCKCGAVEYNKHAWEFGVAIMKEGTYDNSDLFVFKYFEASPVCTEKVLETVYINKLSNFVFNSYEAKFMYTAPNIDLKELFGSR